MSAVNDFRMKATLLAVSVLILALLSACGASSESDEPGTLEGSTSRETPEVVSSGGGNVATPPGVAASSGGQTAPLGIGSYCWGEPGRAAACVDMIGPITGARALAVAKGATISVPYPLPGSQAQEANVTTYQAAGQALPVQGGQQAWPGAASTASQVASTRTPAGLELTADLPPGRYVVDIALRYMQGSVHYGLLLEVR